MKHFYAFSLALLAVSATALSAEATTVNFVCPNHSEAVQVIAQVYEEEDDDFGWGSFVDDTTYDFDSEGKLSVTYDDQRFKVAVKSDSEYVIKSIKADTTDVYISKANGNLASTIEFDFWDEEPDEVTVTINLATEAELYPDVLYLTLDDPTQARVSMSGKSYSTRTIDLSGFEPGVEKAVNFDASTETKVYISNKDYNKDIYKIVKNEEEIDVDYYVEIAADDHLSVYFNYPDEDVHVAINYMSEESKGCITGVSVNGEAISNYDDGFDVQVGSTVTFRGDENMYNYTALSVNDEEYDADDIDFPLTMVVKEATTISVEAHPYSVLNYTVNIDNPDNIIFYRGYSYDGNVEELVEGENALTVSENEPTVQIKPKNSLCLIKSIIDGEGNPLYTSGSSTATITITEGMVLNITTAVIVRDKEFVLYFDDPDEAGYGPDLQRADGTDLNRSGYYFAGYTKFAFGEADNDFQFSFIGVYEEAPNNVYINDVKQSPKDGTTTQYALTLADKDVVKLFFASNPEFYNVSFEVPEDVEMSVVKDLITEASTEGFQALTGTQVDLKVNTEAGYDLYVNDEKVETEENAYSFNVAANTVVKLQMAGVNGVASVASDSNLGNVYNMQGIKVGTDLNRLPAGIYILNGKKVAIK
jgi:hypothetical protein